MKTFERSIERPRMLSLLRLSRIGSIGDFGTNLNCCYIFDEFSYTDSLEGLPESAHEIGSGGRERYTRLACSQATP